MRTVCVHILFRQKVKHVTSLLHRLWASREVELVESDRTVQRVGGIFKNLQVSLLIWQAFSQSLCLLPAWRGSAPSLVSEVVDFAGSAAGFGASSEVGKREPLVLCQRGEVEILGAEEEQRVEQHYGGVGAQLLTLPQVGLHNTRRYDTTTG